MTCRIEHAQADFTAGFNCAASVVAAFAEEHGLSQDHAHRLAGAFGGGMGRTGRGPCGAATGGLMALGLLHGKTQGVDNAARDRCYAVGKDFLEAFHQRCKGLSCQELLGYDVSDPAQYAEAGASGAFARLCPGFLTAAVELVEERMAKP